MEKVGLGASRSLGRPLALSQQKIKDQVLQLCGTEFSQLNELSNGFSSRAFFVGTLISALRNRQQLLPPSDLQNRKIIDLCCFKCIFDLSCFKFVVISYGSNKKKTLIRVRLRMPWGTSVFRVTWIQLKLVRMRKNENKEERRGLMLRTMKAS